MALSYTNTERIYRGPIQVLYSLVTFDSSYAAGGEAVSASDFGLSQILSIQASSKAGYTVRYSKTNDTSGTLAIYASLTPDTSSAVSAPLDSSVGRDYSTVTADLIIYGR